MLIFIVISIGRMNLHAADIYLDVTKKSKSTIAVPDFAPELSEILRNDLRLSGFFTPIGEGKVFLDEEPASYWFSQGADFFISVDLAEKDDIIRLNARLYETGTGKNRLAKGYKGMTSARRLVIHRLSDDITREITGVSGIAATHIAFVHEEGGKKEIYIMDCDGTGKRRLTHHQSISIDPAWSKDGEAIAYMSYKNGSPNLYMIDWRGGRSRVISSFAGLNAHPSWRSDTELGLTLSCDGNSEIYLLDIDKNIKERLTRNKTIDSSPSWSSDGEEVAFTSDREGFPRVYIMKKNGDGVRCLTPQFFYADSSSWSPAGELIAFTGRQGGKFDIFIVHQDGTGLKQITIGPGDNESPSWAPDARHIAFSSNRYGRREIFITDIYGMEEVRITDKGGSYSPTWSPR